MTERRLFFGDVQNAKRAKLLDLIRRAAANGTAKEVAEAILADWFPMCSVDGHGRVSIVLGESTINSKEIK